MADPKKKKYGAKAKKKTLVNAPSSNSARSAFIIARKNLENSSKKNLQSSRRVYKNAKSEYYQKPAIDMEPSPFKMIMGSKQKHDPNNFSQKDQSKMAKIPGAGERRVVGGSGFIGYLGGGAAKLGMKIAARLTGHKAVKAGGKIYGYEKGGKMTNTFKGLFNKSVKDKPAYGIDQYKYAKTKGKAAINRIKKGLK